MRIFWLTAAVSGLVGCTSEHALNETTRTRITNAGGVARSADGKLTLTFPEHALSAPVEVTIAPLAVQPRTAASRIYDLGPNGLTFAQPVSLAIELNEDAPADPGPEQTYVVAQYDADLVAVLASSTYSADAHAATGLLPHFSAYGAFRLESCAHLPEQACGPRPDCEWAEATCRPAAEALCVASGGRWDPDTCGHYDCGVQALACTGVPGCDCGPTMNFVAGTGCELDGDCGTTPECQPDTSGHAYCASTYGEAFYCEGTHCIKAMQCLAVACCIPGAGGDAYCQGAFDPSSTCGLDELCTQPVSTIVLDPATITFSWLPIDSARGGFFGYDPETRTCAAVIFYEDGLPQATRCGPFGSDPMAPYVILRANTDPPCEMWDYAGNVTVTGGDGCADFVEPGGFYAVTDPTRTSLGVALALDNGQDTVTLVADNMSLRAGAVRFGIDFISDVPEDFFVEIRATSGQPGWLQIEPAQSAPLSIYDQCCACGAAMPAYSNLGGANGSRRIDLTWYGDAYNDCGPARTAAPSGNYEAVFCYGFALAGPEGPIVNPQCERVPFSYPADSEVILTVNRGG